MDTYGSDPTWGKFLDRDPQHWFRASKNGVYQPSLPAVSFLEGDILMYTTIVKHDR